MFYASYMLARQEKNIFRNIIIAGVIFVIIGVVILVYTYFAMEKVFIIPYGMIILGVSMSYFGLKKYGRALDCLVNRKKESRRNIFRRF